LLGVLVDLGLPDGDGFDVLASAWALDATVPAAVLSARHDPDAINRTSALGATFLAKPVSIDALRAFVTRAIRMRSRATDSRVAATVAEWASMYKLTRSETDVLLLAARGEPQVSIARARGHSLSTTRKHAENLRLKTGDSSLSAAALRLLRETLDRTE
jgi:DNA-binding NarL/FixJ family response regulator